MQTSSTQERGVDRAREIDCPGAVAQKEMMMGGRARKLQEPKRPVKLISTGGSPLSFTSKTKMCALEANPFSVLDL